MKSGKKFLLYPQLHLPINAANTPAIFSPFTVIMQIPNIIPFIGLVLTAYWQFVVGFKLYKLSKDV